MRTMQIIHSPAARVLQGRRPTDAGASTMSSTQRTMPTTVSSTFMGAKVSVAPTKPTRATFSVQRLVRVEAVITGTGKQGKGDKPARESTAFPELESPGSGQEEPVAEAETKANRGAGISLLVQKAVAAAAAAKAAEKEVLELAEECSLKARRRGTTRLEDFLIHQKEAEARAAAAAAAAAAADSFIPVTLPLPAFGEDEGEEGERGLENALRVGEAEPPMSAADQKEAALIAQHRGAVYFTSPEGPVVGEPLTVYYNSVGRPLEGEGEISIRYGFNRWDLCSSSAPMEGAVQPGWWKATVAVPAQAFRMDFRLTSGHDAHPERLIGPPGAASTIPGAKAGHDDNGGVNFRLLEVEGGPSEEDYVLREGEEDCEARDRAVCSALLRMHSPSGAEPVRVFSRPGGWVRVYYNRAAKGGPDGSHIWAHVGSGGWSNGVEEVVALRQATALERGEDGLIGSAGLGGAGGQLDWWAADVQLQPGRGSLNMVFADVAESGGKGGQYDNNGGRDYHVLCLEKSVDLSALLECSGVAASEAAAGREGGGRGEEGAAAAGARGAERGYLGVLLMDKASSGPLATEEDLMRLCRERRRAEDQPRRDAFRARTVNFIRHAAYMRLPKGHPDVYDPPLDPYYADAQLEHAARKLEGRGVAEIYTSPARRCLESATRVSELLGGVPVHVEPGLQEWNHDNTNLSLSFEEICEFHPSINPAYVSRWPVVPDPETREQLRERGRHMGLVLEQLGESALVVSHGSILANLMEGASGYLDMEGNNFKCAGVCSLSMQSNEFINYNDALNDGCTI